MAAQSSTLRRFFASRWFMAVGLVIFLFISFAYAKASYENYQVQQEIIRLQSEAERLRGKKLETVKMLEYVNSPAYIEEKGRTELNLLKEGEKMAIINSGQNKTNGQLPPPVVESDRLNNLHKWWLYFFGKP